MLKVLSPTLLALALGLGSAGMLSAATAVERDQDVLLIRQLISQGFRLPCEHQMAEFDSANYPDESFWIKRTLREQYLLRFMQDIATPANLSGLQLEQKTLSEQLDAATKAKSLPAVAMSIRAGGGGVLRLVNELAKYIHPDKPPPAVEAAKDKLESAKNQAAIIMQTLRDNYAKAVAQIKANKPQEVSLWDLDEKLDTTKKAFDTAYQLRADGLRDVFNALIGLREVAFRGAAFGLADAQAKTKADLIAFFTDNLKEIFEWDSDFGLTVYDPSENHYLAYGIFSIAQALGLKNAREDDIEQEFQKCIDLDLSRYHDSRVRDSVQGLRLRSMGSLLRWRLEQNTPDAIAKGLATWTEFLSNNKDNPQLRTSNPGVRSKEITDELGRDYVLAARLYAAKGDLTLANASLGTISKWHPAPSINSYGKDWFNFFNNGTNNTSTWSSQPLAIDPGVAYSIAQMEKNEADGSSDEAGQRAGYLKAAMTLRNGLLALNPVSDEASFIESGPALYTLYAQILHHIGMLQQATIIGLQGCETFANYLDGRAHLKKSNPWFKPGTQEWNERPVNPRRLMSNTKYYASDLAQLDPSTQSLKSRIFELIPHISPNDTNANVEHQILISHIEEDQTAGINETKEYAKKNPKDELWAFRTISHARLRQLEKLFKEKKVAEAKTLAQLIDNDNEEMKKRLASDTDHSPKHLKDINDTNTAIFIGTVQSLLTVQDYKGALAAVTDKFASNPPKDFDQTAQLVYMGSKAADDLASKANAGKLDAATLGVVWKSTTMLHHIYAKSQKVNASDSNSDSYLSSTQQHLSRAFYSLANAYLAMPQTKEVHANIDEAYRDFADLYEPIITDKTDPINILFTAKILWDLDAKDRAGPLYERFDRILQKKAEFQAFKKDGRAIIAAYSDKIGNRSELQQGWDEIKALAWNSPEWLQAYDEGITPPTGPHADYFLCRTRIDAFLKKEVQEVKIRLPTEEFNKITTALQDFRKLIVLCEQDLVVTKHLAQYYRETGRPDKALEKLSRLREFDSHDPDAQLATIELTRRRVAEANAKTADIDTAIQLCRNIYEGADRTNQLLKWDVTIDKLELMLAEGQTKAVNAELHYDAQEKIDIHETLVAPRVQGDDPRVHRAPNAQAIDLAKRFLDLYNKTGITEKPRFTCRSVEAGSKTIDFYTDIDAPAFVAKAITTKDDEDLTVIVQADAAVQQPSTGAPHAP